MGVGWVLGVGHCGWGMVSPTMEDTGPLKGQAWEEVPRILPILGSSDLHGDSWRRVGREEKHLQPQTAPCILAGHRQLLALCLFIPDLRCPFYFSPF